MDLLEDSLCIVLYVISALLGGLLGWLLFGGKSAEITRITDTAKRDRAALQDALGEFNTFKNNAKASITAKDNEISKLKKTSALPDIITKAQEKEIKHWKEKATLLEQDLKQAQNNVAPDKSIKGTLIQLEKELKSARKSLTLKNNKIEELNQVVKKSASTQPSLETTKELNKLRKKLKKLKKKVKAQKNVTKTIEIRETLDLDKLKTLLASGELTSKSKKVSKNQKSKAEKLQSKSDS